MSCKIDIINFINKFLGEIVEHFVREPAGKIISNLVNISFMRTAVLAQGSPGTRFILSCLSQRTQLNKLSLMMLI